MTDATAHVALPEDGRTPSLRDWVRDHDESWIFVVLYLGLAVGLSVFVSLFWLVVVAGLHFLLELIRQRHYREGPRSVVLHALWEVKLDVGLVLLALTLVLYIEVVLGILGIQSAARAAAVTRAGARVGTRAAAWERNLRTFLLTVDEMARVVHAGFMLRRKRKRAKAGAPGAGVAPAAGVARGDPGVVEAAAALDASAAVEAPTALDASAAVEAPAALDASAAVEAPAALDASAAAEAADASAAAEVPVAEEATEAPPVPRPPEAVQVAAAAARASSTPGKTSPGKTVADKSAPLPAVGTGPPAPPRPPAWSLKWKLGDRIGLALVVAGVLLMTAAPYLTPHDWASARAVLAEELRPFPGSGGDE